MGSFKARVSKDENLEETEFALRLCVQLSLRSGGVRSITTQRRTHSYALNVQLS